MGVRFAGLVQAFTGKAAVGGDIEVTIDQPYRLPPRDAWVQVGAIGYRVVLVQDPYVLDDYVAYGPQIGWFAETPRLSAVTDEGVSVVLAIETSLDGLFRFAPLPGIFLDKRELTLAELELAASAGS